jgi:hypothetical protein
MREYIEAKTFRDKLNEDKGGQSLEYDELSLDRKGKRRLVHMHLTKYL